MDLGDDVLERDTVGSADDDLVAGSCVPERQEHPAARVRVEVGVASHPWDRGARQMEREVLGSLLYEHVALDVTFGDRKVDRESRDLDAIAVADGPDRRLRRCAGARGTAWDRAG